VKEKKDYITQERMEKSLEYLVSTDEPCAKAKSYLEGLKETKKTILAVEFLSVEGTGQTKDAIALASDNFHIWQNSYKDAVYDYETMRNKRITETLVVETWRSLGANRRQAGGNL